MDAVVQLNTALSGRYAVEREIGAGGMATVYLARDLKHNRNVALKVLRPDLGAVLGVERFLSEIQVTANLQHPNLLPLFDSGEAGGLLFYVMPFVDGESLRARLDRDKQLPVDEALHIATAVASALDYAHRHHVIHRDLKPENILLHEGQPLVADFGIALAVSNAGGGRITQTGLSLGTPHYMSPEQATGDRAVNARTDIYSLGAVTYEMLVGDPPHTASTSQAVIAKVLTEKPTSVRVARPNVPPHVEATVARALEKLPADRWASAREFADGLSGRTFAGSSVMTAPSGVFASSAHQRTLSARLLRVTPWVVAAVAVVVAAISSRRPAPSARSATFTIALADSLRFAEIGGRRVAISGDGSQVALVASTRHGSAIWIRALGDTQARLVRGTERGSGPVFSHDGSWLAFFAENKLKKVPTAGGTPFVLSDSGGVQAHWGDRDGIIYTRLGTLWRVASEGGSATRVARPDTARGHFALMAPHFLPGENAALITIVKGASRGRELGVVTVSDGKVTELGVVGLDARYVPSGHILFASEDGTLFVAPFSLKRRRTTGPPVPLLQQLSVRGVSTAEMGVAADGTLAYLSGLSMGQSRLDAVDLRGVARTVVEQQLGYGWPRVSPDGRRVALEIRARVGSWDIWVLDISSKTLERLTNNFTGVRPAGWSRDGSRVAYLRSSADGLAGLRDVAWIRRDAGGTPEALIANAKVNVEDVSIGPPHTWLAFRTKGYTAPGDIWIAPLDTVTAARPLVDTPADEETPRMSPDGRFVAYVSDETGQFEVYVRALGANGGRTQVSAGGGIEPVWAPGGRSVFYRGPRRVMRATLTTAPELGVANRDSLFEDVYLRGDGRVVQYDVFPSGSELLMIREMTGARAVTVVLNWPELLRTRGAGKR